MKEFNKEELKNRIIDLGKENPFFQFDGSLLDTFPEEKPIKVRLSNVFIIISFIDDDGTEMGTYFESINENVARHFYKLL